MLFIFGVDRIETSLSKLRIYFIHTRIYCTHETKNETTFNVVYFSNVKD